MAEDIPLPLPRPPESQILDADYKTMVAKIAAALATPPQGQPILANGQLGPLNITPFPIQYSGAQGYETNTVTPTMRRR